MDWVKIFEQLGLPVGLLVVGLLAAAWVVKRIFGEGGLVPRVVDYLFCDGSPAVPGGPSRPPGIARQIAASYVELMEELKGAARRSAAYEDESRQQHARHFSQAETACQALRRIDVNAGLLCDAGLHGCELLERVQQQLQAENPELDWSPQLQRIRETLSRVQRANGGPHVT